MSPYWDIQVPGPENYVTVDGTVHHNSGKSVTCVHEILRRATEQAPDANGVRKTRWGVVRNTVDQLRSTTLRTLFDWFPPGVWGVWKSSEKTFTIKVSLPDETTIDCEIMALALDHPDDVRKALSLELTGVFINEAREVAPEVIDGLLMRLRRFPSAKDGGPTWSGAILDSNMPDMDTWFFEQIENPPDNWKIFVQPPAILDREEYINQEGEEPEGEGWRDGTGEMWHTNPAADNLENLDPMYYPDTVQGKGKDFVNVYLRCKYGRSLSGLPVYEESFNPEFHFTKKPPKPIRSPDYPVVIGQDFGRTPAAVMMQRNVLGQIVVFREVTSQNMGIEKFVETKLKPVLAKEFAGCTFIMAPDPAGFFKQQIGEVSPVDLLKKAGFTCVKPATNDPDKRIQAVESVLGRQVDGKPMFVLYEDGCPTLSRGFRYLYRYKTKKTGESDARPEKNEASHPHDAAQYGVLVIEGGVTGGLGLHIPARREIKYASAGGWT